MKYFLIALQFLTILPIKIASEIKKEDFGKSLRYFPIVGVLIGCILALSSIILGFLPPMITAGLILAISIILTGGIHLDGLADTCDGLYAGKSKTEILKIMHDSNIGVMGVLGIASIVVLKFALFYSISHDFLWKALILMAVGGRYSQVLAACLSSYARENGKGKFFVKYATKKELILGAIFTAVPFMLLMRFRGVVTLLMLTAISLLVIQYLKKRIGGVTGDTIGAISEVIEVSALLCLS